MRKTTMVMSQDISWSAADQWIADKYPETNQKSQLLRGLHCWEIFEFVHRCPQKAVFNVRIGGFQALTHANSERNAKDDSMVSSPEQVWQGLQGRQRQCARCGTWRRRGRVHRSGAWGCRGSCPLPWRPSTWWRCSYCLWGGAPVVIPRVCRHIAEPR